MSKSYSFSRGNGTSERFPRLALRWWLRAAAAAAVVLSGAPVACLTASAASPVPSAYPSAIGETYLTWIAVSPAYVTTGTVVAAGTAMNCSNNCFGLWVSHDGGATWRRAAARNWQPSRLAIAADARQHETFFAGSSGALMRSDDDGENWVAAGTGGFPTVLPTYPTQQAVAVAASGGPSDYLLQGVTPSAVTGSDNRLVDLQFAASPEFPSGGSNSPALLVAMDPNTHLPVVLRCTVDFTCSQGTTLSLGVAPSSMTTAGTLLYLSDDYAEHGSVFADTPMGIQKSVDGGATFTPLAVAPADGATVSATPMMALANGYREAGPVRTAYAAVYQAFNTGNGQSRTGGGVYRTVDGGSTWTPLATSGPFGGGALALAAAPDGRLFGGYAALTGDYGLVCSSDGGTTWQASCSPVGTHARSATAPGASTGSCSAGTCAGSASSANGQAGAGADAGTSPGTRRTAEGGSGIGSGVGSSAVARTGLSTSHPWTYVLLAAAALLGAVAVGPPARRLLRRAAGRRRS